MAAANPVAVMTEEEKNGLLAWLVEAGRRGLTLNSQVDMSREEALGAIR